MIIESFKSLLKTVSYKLIKYIVDLQLLYSFKNDYQNIIHEYKINRHC